jgi:hypothetical protein
MGRNHGTLTNFANNGNDAYVASPDRLALNFDGANDHVNVGRNAAFQFDFSSRFSISAWIKTTASTGSGIIGKRPVSAGWYFSIESSNVIGLVLQGTSSAIMVRSVASGVSDGNWHHVAGTYNGNSNASGISLFVDGRQVSTNTILNSAVGSLLNSGDTTIGSVTTNQFFLAAHLDDIILFSTNLTPNEIQFIYEQGRGGGLLMQPPRRRSYFIAPVSGWKSYWIRPSSKLIGAGI